MHYLSNKNEKHVEYNLYLSQLKIDNTPLTFLKRGKLVVCLVEFRPLLEIEHVLAAVMKIYKPSEIGISIMYGNLNKDYVESKFSKWQNIKLIHKNLDNIDRGTYSALLKQPTFYENFLNWSHVLIYQTDSLILRKIDDVYFDYDYIGAPWVESNQWCKYNAGNGGFSLRNVKSCIRACEVFRHYKLDDIPKGNEDGFFCNQDIFKYPPINSELHRAFSVERVNFKYPIGVHQIYHNFNMTTPDWCEFIKYMKDCLILNKASNFDIKTLQVTPPTPTNYISETLDLPQHIGPFTVTFSHKHKNRWLVDCNNNYDVLFCADEDPKSAVCRHPVPNTNQSCIHKKSPGCYYKQIDGYFYIIFYPGFPNGGECWADINTGNNHYNHCKDLPQNGAIILKSHYTPTLPKTINTTDTMDTINSNSLIFDLYSGVGFCNQLFSLELAIYMASISNRYLILNINHPLNSCGKPKWEYGTILEYISTEFKNLLVGFEVHQQSNLLYHYDHYTLDIENKMANCVIIDSPEITYDTEDLHKFAHHRTIVHYDKIKPLFDTNINCVYFNKSNASRIFYNFYTTQERYKLMNQIALLLSKYNTFLSDMCTNVLKPKLHKQFISIHLRMGDWHKSINDNDNITIINNLSKWLNAHNKLSHPVYIMTDKRDNHLLKTLPGNIIYVEDIITNDITSRLKTKYNDITVASFLLQKYIIEQSSTFIGSQGSTVSTHINYNNYINNKSYNLITKSSSNTFDTGTLTYRILNNHKYTWNQINFMGGHPVSWCMFFSDNIYKNTVISTNIISPPDSIVTSKYNNVTINNSAPFISIDFWILLSDIVLDNYPMHTDIINIKPNKIIIIYVKTDLLPAFIDVLNNINYRFILITTSNDDHCVPYLDYTDQNFMQKTDTLLRSKFLLKWYTKNACIIHQKLQPIPIGPKWQWKTTAYFGENKNKHLKIFNKLGLNPEFYFYNNSYKYNLLYFNFSLTTNNPFLKEHKNIRNVVKNKMKLLFTENSNNNFEDYMHTLSSYKFSLAPPGRGIDTHRCWESLMVGTIPIVLSSPLNDLYNDLPVLVVESYDIITPTYLNEAYNNFRGRSYKFDKIYSNYWTKSIVSVI